MEVLPLSRLATGTLIALSVLNAPSHTSAQTVVGAVKSGVEATPVVGEAVRDAVARLGVRHADRVQHVLLRVSQDSLELVPHPAEEKLRESDVLFIPYASLHNRADRIKADAIRAALRVSPDAEDNAALWNLATRLLADSPSPAERVFLHALFVDSHQAERERIRHIHALGELGPMAADALPSLTSCLERPGRLAQEAAQAIGRLGPVAREAIPALEGLLAKLPEQGGSTDANAIIQQAMTSLAAEATPASRNVDELGLKVAIAFDSASLRWHYANFLSYTAKYKRPPRGAGATFVLDPWVRWVVQHNVASRDRLFSAALIDRDARYERILETDPSNLWRTSAEIRPDDTHFFGPAADRPDPPRLFTAKVPLMATPMYADGSTLVLWGDGNVEQVRIPLNERATWTPAALGLVK